MRHLLLTLGILGSCANSTTPKPDTAKLVEKVMYLCNAEGSIRQLATVQALSVEGLDTLPTEMHRDFLLLICIESRFDPKAVSPVGARGLTQIMPRFLAEFAQECGIKLAKSGGTERDSVLVGACRFKLLHQRFSGNMALVLAAYNAGENSATIRKMQRLERINTETADYISRYTYLQYEFQRSLLPTSGSGAPLPSGSQDRNK